MLNWVYTVGHFLLDRHMDNIVGTFPSDIFLGLFPFPLPRLPDIPPVIFLLHILQYSRKPIAKYVNIARCLHVGQEISFKLVKIFSFFLVKFISTLLLLPMW